MPSNGINIEDLADLHKQIVALKNERAVFLDTIAQSIGTLEQFLPFLPLCDRLGCKAHAEFITQNHAFRCSQHATKQDDRVQSSVAILETLRVLKGINNARM